MKKHFSEKIRTLRKQRGWDQAALASSCQDLKASRGLTGDAAKFSIRIVRDIESGIGNPTLDNMLILGELFGLSISDFLGDKRGSRDELFSGLVERLTALDEDQLGRIFRFLNKLLANSATSANSNDVG